MDGQRTVETVPATQPVAQWVCKNCGTFNVDGTTHCSECGFVRGYDPETDRAVTVGEVPPAVSIESEAELPPRLGLYLGIAQVGLMLLLLGVFTPLLIRLYQNWPFQSPFERDAGELGKGLLTLQARIDSGVSKAQYDEMLAPLLGEEAAFKATFEHAPEHTRDSYQNLVQSAEYYGIAGDAWETQLTTNNVPLPLQEQASSRDAEKTVKNHWDRAKEDALVGMRLLRR